MAGGPFQGLAYVRENELEAYTQKLLGTYEKELWPVVEEVIAKDYSTIIDIGAAEGYYVCGLALRMPKVRVIAFEAQKNCLARLWALANRNRLADRIEQRGFCRAEDLQAALEGQDNSIVLCDVEGAEFELLNPQAIPQLESTDVLVEVHEHFRAGLRESLLTRFQGTHDVRVIRSEQRTINDLPAGVALDMDLALSAMEESRGASMEWFWMTSRSRSGSTASE